jgi:EAL domain-containing protein (putative c-di-GMP-specific phosphodiesterase class I)
MESAAEPFDQLVMSVHGLVFSAGGWWEHLLAPGPESLRRRSVTDLVALPDRPVFALALERLRRGEVGELTVALRLNGATGELSAVRLRLRVIETHHGRPTLVGASRVDAEGPGAAATAAVVAEAWRRRQVSLWRQPIRDVETLAVVREELLVRMQLPGGEVLVAARFVPILEQLGLIAELDVWVLEAALAEIAAGGGAPVALEVNLSLSAPRDRARLLGVVRAALDGGRLHGGELVVALPAAVLTTNRAALLELLHGLVAAGLRIAIDGVEGTREQLDAVADIPADIVKLAPGLARDPEQLDRVMRDIHDHGALATGERVQSAAALTLLRRHGADEAQGFHLGSPEPPPDQPTLFPSGPGPA